MFVFECQKAHAGERPVRRKPKLTVAANPISCHLQTQ